MNIMFHNRPRWQLLAEPTTLSATAGQPFAPLTIKLTDAHHQPLGGQPALVSVDAIGLLDPPAVVVSDHQGLYKIELTAGTQQGHGSLRLQVAADLHITIDLDIQGGAAQRILPNLIPTAPLPVGSLAHFSFRLVDQYANGTVDAVVDLSFSDTRLTLLEPELQRTDRNGAISFTVDTQQAPPGIYGIQLRHRHPTAVLETLFPLTVTAGPPTDLNPITTSGSQSQLCNGTLAALTTHPAPLWWQLTDQFGYPVPNMLIRFETTQGALHLEPPSDYTDRLGRVQTTVTAVGAHPQSVEIWAHSEGSSQLSSPPCSVQIP